MNPANMRTEVASPAEALPAHVALVIPSPFVRHSSRSSSPSVPCSADALCIHSLPLPSRPQYTCILTRIARLRCSGTPPDQSTTLIWVHSYTGGASLARLTSCSACPASLGADAMPCLSFVSSRTLIRVAAAACARYSGALLPKSWLCLPGSGICELTGGSFVPALLVHLLRSRSWC